MELTCSVNNYAWGKIGLESTVAQLARTSSPGLEINEDEPYAELWMGIHPSGPSKIRSTGQHLSKWLEEQPETLGPIITEMFEGSLPFLFKVLSVNKALSIQAHPTKEHAAGLHFKNPHLYPDPNHKPEIAIALTSFQALCGFRAYSEIQQFLKEIPELKAIIGEQNVKAFVEAESYTQRQDALKACFTSLISSTEFKPHLKTLVEKPKTEGTSLASVKDLLDKLNEQFPGDIGCLSIFFLNHMTLEPGQAVFLAPNEPHAYLYGDCIECMACSDNVVRAGLTPKYIDVPTLCDMLSYCMRPAAENLFDGKQIDSHTILFAPPVPDFAVYQIKITENTKEYCGPVLQSASILIVIEGEAVINEMQLKRGSVAFLPYQSSLTLKDSKDFLAYVATCLPKGPLL